MRNKKLQKLSKEVTASKVSILDSNEIKMISGGTGISDLDVDKGASCSGTNDCWSFSAGACDKANDCWGYS